MSDKLKEFVNEHRQEFDTGEPGKDLWEKIDAQMEAKNSSRISSKWLSAFKYGFSASVLVVAVYFITSNLTNSTSNELALIRKDSATNHSEHYHKADQAISELKYSENNATNDLNDFPGNKNGAQGVIPFSSHGRERDYNLQDGKKDSVLNAGSFETGISDQEKNESENSAGVSLKETKINSANEKNETHLTGKKKKTDLYTPAEPENINSYTATLYEGPTLCSVLRAYKFPGKVKKDVNPPNENNQNKKIVVTISCSGLERIPNMTAVWLKGKTDKKITLSLKKRFKDIVLVKSDGRKSNPEAVSHYYAGLGAISEYKGKHLTMIFNDKVDLILFFTNAEEGDKILINGILEAVVKNQP